MIVVIQNFDPLPKGASEPLELSLVRRFSSPEGSEYWLATLPAVFEYETKDGRVVQVSNVVVAPGWVGQSFADGFHGRVNLAYVTDNSLAFDEFIDFKKCDYVTYGSGMVVPGHVA